MSSQSEIKKFIEAGRQDMKVAAGGDFIFLKESSRPVRVTVDGQSILMRRGDKRRIDRKDPTKIAFDSFEISNSESFDMQVIFVVGEGDYNSQIFSGELSLVESIKTLGGASHTHGIDLQYYVGFDEWEPSVEYEMQELATNIDLTTDYGYQAMAVYDYDLERVYMWGNNGRFRVLDKDLAEISSTAHGWSFDPDSDQQWAYSDGRIYFVSGDDLMRIDVIDNPSPVVAGTLKSGGPVRYRRGDGGFIRNGYLYLIYDLSSSNGYQKLFEVHAIKGDGSLEWVADVPIGGFAGGGGDVYHHRERDRIYIIYNSVAYEYDFASPMEINFLGTAEHPYSAPHNSLDGNFKIIWWSDHENRILTATTHTDKCNAYLRAVKDREVQLHAYLWDGVDPTTKKYFWVSGIEHIYFKNGGLVLIGDILGQIIRGLTAAGISVLNDDQLEKYRDYVTMLEYTDGRNVYKKDAGSSTWAYSEFNDRGELFIPSQVKLRVLPDLLTNVY